MGNPILVKKSEKIFEDKFHNLSLKDIAIELKHYRVGTAPENPSFVANQEEAKRKIIEKFKDFFGSSIGLELSILISHIGDGKTHFIRMIGDAFSGINNVRVRRVYIRNEQVDIKFKILEAIERSEIKNCISNILRGDDFLNRDESLTIASLQEKYDINKNLAITLAKGNSQNLKVHTQAIQLLKGNFDEEFIKTYLYDFENSSEEFYFGFLRLLCDYLESEGIYLIIVFDEMEHVMDWKDQEDQKKFFRNIKELTDKITLYKNLFLIFAATQIYGGTDFVQHINLIEPATYDRMKSLFIKLNDINSDEEVINLINYLKKRYEKYYSIILDEDLVFSQLKQQFKTERVEDTYRDYAQGIMKIFDELRDQQLNKKDNSKGIETEKIDLSNKDTIKLYDKKKEVLKKWNNSTQPGKKVLIVEALGALLGLGGKKIINMNKSIGYLIIETKNKEKKIYYVIYTTQKNSKKWFNDKLKQAINIQEQNFIKSLVCLYPEKLIKLSKEKIKEYADRGINVVSYNDELINKLLILLDENVSIDEKKRIENDIKKVVSL